METDVKYHTEYRVYEMLRVGSDYMWVGDILYVHLGWAWRYKRAERRGNKRGERTEVSERETQQQFVAKSIRSKVKQEQPVFLLPLSDAQLDHV